MRRSRSMLGPPKLRLLDQPITVSLEDLVPVDNFYRFLDAKLDLTFVRTWVQELYAAGGRPSIDPVVFFKLQLILFFEGIRSERKLMATVALNLAHRWYLGYRLDEPLPDHSSLTRIRARLDLPLFQRFFDHVVELCQQAGLVWGKEVLFDGTKVRANAAMDSLRSHWAIAARAHLAALFAGEADGPPPWAPPGAADAAPDAPVEGGAPEPTSAPSPAGEPDAAVAEDTARPRQLPFQGTPEEEQQLAAANQSTWKLLEERRRAPDQPSSRGYQRLSDQKASTTDPDATPMRTTFSGVATLGYHDHYVVDGGKARIILAALVTPADVMDNTPMLDLLQRVRFRWKLTPEQVVADSKYGTVENLHALDDLGIRAYVPMPDFDGRTPYYPPSQFTFDAERDEYRCPQGQPLRRYTAKHTEGGVMYRADAATCNACPVKAACTTSSKGRTLRRSLAGKFMERLHRYQGTPEYEKALRKRRVWVEPLFGEAKEWHGLRRFRLRGLWKVNCEGLLIAAGQNLKRWLSRMGWGRRHGPAGSVALAHPLPATIVLITIP